jgi:hypothetical protein
LEKQLEEKEKMVVEKEMINQNLKQEMKDVQYENENKESDIRAENERKLKDKEA